MADYSTALIVDIQGFTKMCKHDDAILLADFIRDVFIASVGIVEKQKGIVANTMGDAILCLFKDPCDALVASWGIIHDFWQVHESLVGCGKRKSKALPFIENGLYCRCAIETGEIDSAKLKTKRTRFRLWVGNPINYAQRIMHFQEKKRNTLIIGPNAKRIIATKYAVGRRISQKAKNVMYFGYPVDTTDCWGD